MLVYYICQILFLPTFHLVQYNIEYVSLIYVLNLARATKKLIDPLISWVAISYQVLQQLFWLFCKRGPAAFCSLNLYSNYVTYVATYIYPIQFVACSYIYTYISYIINITVLSSLLYTYTYMYIFICTVGFKKR